MTIRQIAELAECSPSTVSRVLSSKKSSIPISKKTKEKILAVCKEYDYTPNINASRFFSKQAKIIGLLIPSTESLIDDNLAKGMNAIYDTLQRNSYRMLLLTMDKQFIENKEYLNLFKRREIDALIIWGASGDCKWIDELAANKMPFVLLTNPYKNHPAVYCDDSVGITQLVKHCQARGAESFVYVTVSGGDCCLRRRTSFSEWIPNGKFIKGCLNIEDCEKIADTILKQRPDAVICGNDRCAIGLEKALLEADLTIPKDIMITGADNIELAKYCPIPLTTYDQMAHKCGEVCANMILDFLDKQKQLSSISIPPELCIRGSA
ncbi:MAG: LacI family DNA-binding transcriptional regulator [Lentisphaeria bacterium]